MTIVRGMPRDVLLLDPSGSLASLGRCFQQACGEGARLLTVTSTTALLDALQDHDLVVVHQRWGDGERSGEGVVAAIRQHDPDIPTVMVAERGSVEDASAAVAAGANDFMVQGEDLDDRVTTQLTKLRQLMRHINDKRQLARDNEQLRQALRPLHSVVGKSTLITTILKRVERLGPIPRPVLIVGERGTGKELVARALHRASRRRGPLVAVNCAALSDALIDSEMFGHERGAFSGAQARHIGKFEQAHNGTLFLDEIGNMSLAFQQKMLRAVEYGKFCRVGGDREVDVATRIVAATNAPLAERIAGGAFLADLYDRLAFEVIEVPPLRARRDDIPLLAQHFMRLFVEEVPSLGDKRLSEDALAFLANHDFPGNIRELKNIIERAVYRDTTDEITPDDLGLTRAPTAPHNGGLFRERMAALECELVASALRDTHNNQAEAARALGLKYHQLRYLMKKYSLGG